MSLVTLAISALATISVAAPELIDSSRIGLARTGFVFTVLDGGDPLYVSSLNQLDISGVMVPEPSAALLLSLAFFCLATRRKGRT